MYCFNRIDFDSDVDKSVIELTQSKTWFFFIYPRRYNSDHGAANDYTLQWYL